MAGIHLRETRWLADGLHNGDRRGNPRVNARSTGGVAGEGVENPITEVLSGENVQCKNCWQNEPRPRRVVSDADSLASSAGDCWAVPIQS